MSEILNWNDAIENDGSGEFAVVPAGEYDFIVVDMERQHSNKSNAPMAKLTLEINHDGTSTKVFDYLVLTRKAEWKLSSFFRAIGMKRHGEPFVMNWNRVIGARGRVQINVEPYEKRDGTQGESNKVKQYLDPPTGAMHRTSTPPPVDDDDDGLI